MINIDKLEKMEKYPTLKEYLLISLQDNLFFMIPLGMVMFFAYNSFLIVFLFFLSYYVTTSIYFYKMDKKIFNALHSRRVPPKE